MAVCFAAVRLRMSASASSKAVKWKGRIDLSSVAVPAFTATFVLTLGSCATSTSEIATAMTTLRLTSEVILQCFVSTRSAVRMFRDLFIALTRRSAGASPSLTSFTRRKAGQVELFCGDAQRDLALANGVVRPFHEVKPRCVTIVLRSLTGLGDHEARCLRHERMRAGSCERDEDGKTGNPSCTAAALLWITTMDAQARRCRQKFLKFFPQGFKDSKYLEWERNYKWQAHEQWSAALNKAEYQRLLKSGEYLEVANRAVRIESKTNLLFSFEKMALRDAVKAETGAKAFTQGLFDWIYGTGERETRFLNFAQVLDHLPRRQTRVLTWPLQTVFGFIARPDREIFLKPQTTKIGAEAYGFDFEYASKPNWETYASLLEFAAAIKRDLVELEPRDMMDVQSFIWVLGSSEYSD